MLDTPILKIAAIIFGKGKLSKSLVENKFGKLYENLGIEFTALQWLQLHCDF